MTKGGTLADYYGITYRVIHRQLNGLSNEDLEKPAGDGETVGEQIAFSHWHETYHVGQLELLRQLSGKNDKVI